MFHCYAQLEPILLFMDLYLWVMLINLWFSCSIIRQVLAQPKIWNSRVVFFCRCRRGISSSRKVLLTLCPTPYTGDKFCPWDDKNNKSCYATSSHAASWTMASEICSSAGGFLAEIESPMEGEILRDNIVELLNEFWIGGIKNESWRWTSSQKLIQTRFSDIAYSSKEKTGTIQWRKI